MAQKIILDTDPGIDDSLALLFALCSPELDVVGVTTVFGNTPVEKATQNALRVLEAGARADIPVATGAKWPLVRPYRGRGPQVHGEDGLGNTFLPPPSGSPLDVPASHFIARTVMEQAGEITLIAVGPLTNLAWAHRLEPRLAAGVRRVVIMGGAAFCPGNISPVAEANLYNDPEAAAVVFSAGWPVVMVGLDVTAKTVMTNAYFDELAGAGNARTDFIARIVPFYLEAYRRRYGMDGVHTHDPSAIAYAVEPGLFAVERVPIWVETEGRCSGQTVPDLRRQWDDVPEIDVCVDVDSARLLALIKERLTQSPISNL